MAWSWNDINVSKLPQIAPPLKAAQAQAALDTYEKKKEAMKGPLPNSFMVYMTKWLPIASGNRVSYSHCMSFDATFHVFKCDACQQNLNVGADLFYNGVNTADPLVPSELQDWVKIHRHVCKVFQGKSGAETGGCTFCGWTQSEHMPKFEDGGIVTHISNYDKNHEKMQLLMMQNAMQAKKLKLQAQLAQLNAYQESVAPAPVSKELEVLEQPSGRKFRQ